jgi:hypothetical protein
MEFCEGMTKNYIKKHECGGGDNTRKRHDVNPYLFLTLNKYSL